MQISQSSTARIIAAVVDDAVAETKVAVHHRALGLRRDACREQLVHTIDGRDLAGLRRLELRVPPLELARHQLVASREVAETDGVDVDRVQRRPVRRRATRRCGRVRSSSSSAIAVVVVVQHDARRRTTSRRTARR